MGGPDRSNAGLRSLHDRMAEHRRRVRAANWRTGLMVALVLLPASGVLYAIARLLVWRAATGSYSAFLARSLNGEAWALALQGLLIQNQIRVAVVHAGFTHLVLPMIALGFLVIIGVSWVQHMAQRRLYDRPALVRQFLRVEECAFAGHAAFIRRAGLGIAAAAAACIAVVFSAPKSLSTPVLLFFLLATTTAVIVGGARWIHSIHKASGQRRIPAAYAKATCLAGAIRQLTFAGAMLIILGGALCFAAWSAAAATRADAGKSWIDRVASWERRVATYDASEHERKLLADLDGQLHASINGVTSAQRLSTDLLQLDTLHALAAVLFFILCAVACLDIGLTLSWHEHRHPFTAVGLGLVAAVVLGLVETGMQHIFPTASAFHFAAGMGTLLLTFVLGQLSALLIRLFTERGMECPVCLARTDTDATRCSACGLYLRHAHANAYIGNTTTGELHLPSCRHVTRISPEARKPYGSLEDALWDGYDPCGACLGASVAGT